MTGADWIILVVILLSVIQAASSGFFQEAFGIAGLVLGYLLAAWNYQRLASHFASYGAAWLVEIAAFLVIFVGVMLLAGIAGRITRWMMQEAGLTLVDRIFGAALGLLRGCLINAVALVSLAAFTPTSKWLQGSELAPYFLVAGRAVVWVAPAELRTRFYQGLDLLRQQERQVK
ncbi:MAG TPA: CvpA family protein [Terriglobales bacterium]|nr:CvpA family protein [Terriglobales bacterium]